jgi:hypothetical protein
MSWDSEAKPRLTQTAAAQSVGCIADGAGSETIRDEVHDFASRIKDDLEPCEAVEANVRQTC